MPELKQSDNAHYRAKFAHTYLSASIAIRTYFLRSSFDAYCGSSSLQRLCKHGQLERGFFVQTLQKTLSHLLKQVCARGSRPVVQPSIVKSLMLPSEPCNALKPCTGTRLVPVANCSSRARCSWLNSPSASQNQRMTLCVSRLLSYSPR